MKTLARSVVLALLVSAPVLHAQQWSEPTQDTMTTTDKVAIGSLTAPARQLEVFGDASVSAVLSAGEVKVMPIVGSTPGRLHQAVSQWVGMTLNTRFQDPTGWFLDDTGRPGWFVKADGRDGFDQFSIFRIAPGPNPSNSVKQLFVINQDGNVGIGWPTPASPLVVVTPNSGGASASFRDTLVAEGYPTGVLLEMTVNSLIKVSNLQIGRQMSPSIDSVNSLPLRLNTTNANDVIVGETGFNTALLVKGSGLSTFAGAVKVGGDLTVDGNVAAKFQDLAEWVPSREDLDAGTVVVLDASVGNGVMASSVAYDTTVAGVVSLQPGIILGERGPSKEQIATTGRVKVKVDATSGPIRVGDLLVTSDKPGRAMKSSAIDLGEVSIHRPGTILGKALEPLEAGEGEILVLLSLQ